MIKIHNQHCSSSDYSVYIMDFYLLLPNTYYVIRISLNPPNKYMRNFILSFYRWGHKLLYWERKDSNGRARTHSWIWVTSTSRSTYRLAKPLSLTFTIRARLGYTVLSTDPQVSYGIMMLREFWFLHWKTGLWLKKKKKCKHYILLLVIALKS